jgi:hypothetical protein
MPEMRTIVSEIGCPLRTEAVQNAGSRQYSDDSLLIAGAIIHFRKKRRHSHGCSVEVVEYADVEFEKNDQDKR